MKKIFIRFLFLSVFMMGVSFAQDIRVYGVVKSSIDTIPLMGATVFVKGESIGVQTDFDGLYELVVPKGSTVVYSYVGMNSREIVMQSDAIADLGVVIDKEVNVTLTPSEDSKLDEIVMTGFSKIEKNKFTGAASKVKMDDISLASAPDIGHMLQGTVAGVAVSNVSSVFGTEQKIRIRGSSSITGINSPLWVVDGVVQERRIDINSSDLYSGSLANLLSSSISGLDATSIEDIQVLKDASATALYGSRAVNGVIVITTKKGKKGTGLTASFTSTVTTNFKPSILQFDVLNSKDQIEYNQEIFYNYQQAMLQSSARTSGTFTKLIDMYNRRLAPVDTYENFLSELDKYKKVNTDWFKYLFNQSLNVRQSASLSYGGEKFTSYFSMGLYKDYGNTIGQSVNQTTLNSNATYDVNSRLKLSANLMYSSSEQRNPSTRVNPFSYARTTSRAMRPYQDNGEYEYYKKQFTPFNILEEIDNQFVTPKTLDVKIQFNLDYEILDNLTFSSLFSSRKTNSSYEEIITEKSNLAKSYRNDLFKLRNENYYLYKDPDGKSYELPVTTLPRGGILNTFNTEGNFIVFRNSLNYVFSLDSQKNHSIDLIAGSELLQNEWYNIKNKNYGYAYFSGKVAFPDYKAIKKEPEYYNVSEKFINTVSFYGTANYTYKDLYSFTAILRSDATNIMGKTVRYKFLPTWTVAFAWQTSNESFFPESLRKYIDRVKFRGSYGLRGNSGKRGGDILANYASTDRLFNASDNNETIIRIDEPENIDLTYEKEYSVNFGLEMTLFKTLDVVVDVYKRNNFNLIGRKPVSFTSGYSSKNLNWASMSNEGIEVLLKTKPFKLTNDLNFFGTFTFGYNKNRVLSQLFSSESVFEVSNNKNGYPIVDKPLSGMYSFRFKRINEEGMPLYLNKDSKEVVALNQQEQLSLENLVYSGVVDPPVSLGFTYGLNYKNFRLNLTFNANLGHVVRLNPLLTTDYLNDNLAVNSGMVSRWKYPGHEKTTNVPRIFNQTDGVFYLNSSYSEDNYVDSYNNSDLRVVPASFARFKSASLSYHFSNDFVKRLRFKSLDLEIQMNNIYLFTSSSLRGQDPEALISGINLPAQRSLSFIMNITL